MDTDSIVREWKEAFAKHPMFGEGVSRDSMDRMWESSSANYSDARYSEIKDMIVKTLFSEGYIGKEDTVLDLGSGPGTFAVPFSSRCRSVLCVDGSEGMLSRITKKGIGNISVLKADCTCLPNEYRRDVVFCSLCPAMNDPDAIDRMDGLGRKHVFISSANHEMGIEGEIWDALGKDYSYAGYDTDYPYRYLLSKGVDAKLRYFTQDNTVTDTVDATVGRFRAMIANYRAIGEEEERVIRSIVKDHSENGIVKQSIRLRMGMLTW